MKYNFIKREQNQKTGSNFRARRKESGGRATDEVVNDVDIISYRHRRKEISLHDVSTLTNITHQPSPPAARVLDSTWGYKHLSGKNKSTDRASGMPTSTTCRCSSTQHGSTFRTSSNLRANSGSWGQMHPRGHYGDSGTKKN